MNCSTGPYGFLNPVSSAKQLGQEQTRNKGRATRSVALYTSTHCPRNTLLLSNNHIRIMILRSSIRTHPCVSTISCKPIPNLTIRTPHITLQVRHATLLRRPKRPYQFTQLVTLSDGSTFTHRTTSPQAVYKSVKDVRNAPMWNPSSERLNNIEEDEAGRLARFRERFGRGWDADSVLDSQATQVRLFSQSMNAILSFVQC